MVVDAVSCFKYAVFSPATGNIKFTYSKLHWNPHTLAILLYLPTLAFFLPKLCNDWFAKPAKILHFMVLDRMLFSACPCSLPHCAYMPFHCTPWFLSGKGWQLTHTQHTRRLTHMQDTKSDWRASTIVQHTKYMAHMLHIKSDSHAEHS